MFGYKLKGKINKSFSIFFFDSYEFQTYMHDVLYVMLILKNIRKFKANIFGGKKIQKKELYYLKEIFKNPYGYFQKKKMSKIYSNFNYNSIFFWFFKSNYLINKVNCKGTPNVLILYIGEILIINIPKYVNIDFFFKK